MRLNFSYGEALDKTEAIARIRAAFDYGVTFSARWKSMDLIK